MSRNHGFGDNAQADWRSSNRHMTASSNSYTRLTSTTVPAKKEDSSAMQSFLAPLAETYKKLLKRMVFM